MKSLLILSLLFIGCVFKNNSIELESINNEIWLLDSFIDSLEIGNKGNNKIELSCYRFADKPDSVTLQFYAKNYDKWILKNNLALEYNGVRGFGSKLEDLNNDGYLDFHYNSMEAARGANDIRKIFMYSPEFDSLYIIKNSENYPNLRYNKELDCIDAFLVTGSCSTVFLKLDNDSLKEIAWVHAADYIVVTEINADGKSITLLDTINTFGDFERFINYKPLKTYSELQD